MTTFLQRQHQPHLQRRNSASYRERGMTLIELVIAIAIMGVIVGAVYEFLIFANRETRAAGTKEEVVEKVNLFFLRVSQDIRNAEKCEILDSNSELTLHLLDEGQVTYEWYEDNSSSSGKRKGIKRNGIPVLESENITSVEFNEVDSGVGDDKTKMINIMVEAEIVVAGREQSGPFNQTFSTTVTCRNRSES